MISFSGLFIYCYVFDSFTIFCMILVVCIYLLINDLCVHQPHVQMFLV